MTTKVTLLNYYLRDLIDWEDLYTECFFDENELVALIVNGCVRKYGSIEKQNEEELLKEAKNILINNNFVEEKNYTNPIYVNSIKKIDISGDEIKSVCERSLEISHWKKENIDDYVSLYSGADDYEELRKKLLSEIELKDLILKGKEIISVGSPAIKKIKSNLCQNA